MSPIRMPDDSGVTRTKYIEERIVHTHKTGSIIGGLRGSREGVEGSHLDSRHCSFFVI